MKTLPPDEEIARWERVCIEPEYMVWGPDVNDAGKGYAVVDAECVHLCYCDTEERAEVVASAVNLYDERMWKLHAERQDSTSAKP